MLSLTCLCGRVRLDVATRPAFIHECNCTLCSKAGARWSYHLPAEVEVRGDTSSYTREDKENPAAEVHFCPRCGSTTHFTLTPGAVAKFGDTQLGVNMGLADEAELDGVELRFPDGRAWSGGSAFGYVREPRILGRGSAS